VRSKAGNDFLYAIGKKLVREQADSADDSNAIRAASNATATHRWRDKFRRYCYSTCPRSELDLSFNHLELMNRARGELSAALRESHLLRVRNLSEAELASLRRLKQLVKDGKLIIRKADKAARLC
jgi:hypothetical protein